MKYFLNEFDHRTCRICVCVFSDKDAAQETSVSEHPLRNAVQIIKTIIYVTNELLRFISIRGPKSLFSSQFNVRPDTEA